jgi:hypothetical protein
MIDRRILARESKHGGVGVEDLPRVGSILMFYVPRHHEAKLDRKNHGLEGKVKLGG